MINDYFQPVYPRELSQQRLDLNKRYRQLFKDTDLFVKENLDKAVTSLRKKNPQFIHAYKDLRIIK